MGSEMAILPTEPVFSKLLITSLKTEYLELRESVSAIVSMLSVENIFYSPKSQDKDIKKKRRKFAHMDSDHLTLLNIFNMFTDILKKKSKKEAIAFARDNFLNEKSLMKAVLIQE